MLEDVAVRVPHGIWVDGTRHCDAGLRVLTGSDEAFVLALNGKPAVERVTALLARCVTRLGPLAVEDSGPVRALTVGDREALLLHLRCLVLDDRLQCVLACPDPACGQKMELELPVHDMLVAPYADAAEWHETSIAAGGETVAVRFRLATGADQEAAAQESEDPQAGAQMILRRCVQSVHTSGGQHIEPDEWPDELASALAARMADLDPQAELLFNLTCPECGLPFTALFDAESFVLQELANHVRHLYREVHMLAFYYHWSEAEIMAMPAHKRRLYLTLLTEALEGIAR